MAQKALMEYPRVKIEDFQNERYFDPLLPRYSGYSWFVLEVHRAKFSGMSHPVVRGCMGSGFIKGAIRQSITDLRQHHLLGSTSP